MTDEPERFLFDVDDRVNGPDVVRRVVQGDRAGLFGSLVLAALLVAEAELTVNVAARLNLAVGNSPLVIPAAPRIILFNLQKMLSNPPVEPVVFTVMPRGTVVDVSEALAHPGVKVDAEGHLESVHVLGVVRDDGVVEAGGPHPILL
jgi:hypothetical protein